MRMVGVHHDLAGRAGSQHQANLCSVHGGVVLQWGLGGMGRAASIRPAMRTCMNPMF